MIVQSALLNLSPRFSQGCKIVVSQFGYNLIKIFDNVMDQAKSILECKRVLDYWEGPDLATVYLRHMHKSIFMYHYFLARTSHRSGI